MQRWFKTGVLGALALMGGTVTAQDFKAAAPSLIQHPTATAVVSDARAKGDPTPAPSLDKNNIDAWLDGYMPHALAVSDIPGAVVVVVKGDKVLTARGFGYADLARRTPVDPGGTLFRLGSVSKLFTWTAVMQLVEQGKLDLDVDVNRYLDFRIPDRDGKPITLRQIMTHTAGFEEAAKGLIGFDAGKNPTLEAYLKRWTPKRIFAPGTTPAYSNWATTLAAYIVQRTSSEPFDAYLERHVFAPLGMRNSTFRQPLPAHLAGHMATGYATPGSATKFEFVAPAPAGSATMSGTDVAHFMIAHLQRGSFGGQRILKPETADLMHASPLAKVNPMSLIPPLNRMELGFFETNVNGREVIGHLGDTQAFHTSLHLFMKEGVGLLVSFNGAGKDGAVQPLRTAVFEDFADRYLPNIAPADGRVDAKTSAEHARMMAGRWIASRRADSSFLSAVYWLKGQVVISAGAKGELMVPSLTNAAGRPREWVEIAPFVWRDRYGHDLLAAKVQDGRVLRWSFNLAAPFEMFEPVPAHLSAGWIVPALIASIAILLATFLLWPAAFFVRRHFQAPALVTGRALRVQRATRLLAGLAVALTIGWMIVITQIFASNGGDDSFDGVLWALQVASAMTFFAAPLAAAWNLQLTWAHGRHWPSKAWSVLVLLAALIVLYVAVVFNLVAMVVNF